MRRISLIVPLLLSFAVLARSADFTVSPKAKKFEFVAFGDLRANPDEGPSSNGAVRRALLNRIAELKPSLVVVTGDLVLRGNTPEHWATWDTESKPLRDAGVPIFPVLGNHDVYRDAKAETYFAHLPQLQNRRWYTVRHGNVLLVMLDSTSHYAPGSEQGSWLDQQLSTVPADIDFLVIALHHPPYTNSSDQAKGGGHSARAQEQQLAVWLAARRKTLRQPILVLAGHVHAYERYEHDGVTYITTGGGGATPYEIQRGPQDAYREPGPAYHFLRFFVDGRTLGAEMVKLTIDDGKPQWRVRDSFRLQAPKRAKAAAR